MIAQTHFTTTRQRLNLVVECVTLTDGRTRYLVTRRGDLAVIHDADSMAEAQAYIRAH